MSVSCTIHPAGTLEKNHQGNWRSIYLFADLDNASERETARAMMPYESPHLPQTPPPTPAPETDHDHDEDGGIYSSQQSPHKMLTVEAETRPSGNSDAPPLAAGRALEFPPALQGPPPELLVLSFPPARERSGSPEF